MIKSSVVFTIILLVNLVISSPVQKGHSQEMCKLPKMTGACRAHMRRWRYDPAAGTCEQFTYGGCKGNENNFVTKEACMDTCSGV